VGDKINRILASTDFSNDSRKAVDYAVFLAKSLDAELQLVHVLEPPFPSTDPAYLKMLGELAEADAQKLKSLAKEIEQRLPNVRSFCREGAAAVTIVKTAEELGSDLIVLGTHGRTGMAHAFIGSVAERVLRLAHCPVITVRGDEAPPLETKGATIPLGPSISPAG
jgi:nucleotide-binding universal stress UspA family protein